MEPRTLLSGDPITAAAQSALTAGLTQFASATASLQQFGQLAANVPVISSPIGTAIQLPAALTTNLVTPIQNYLANNTQPTIQGLATALSAGNTNVTGSFLPAGTTQMLGQFADGEYLLTLNAWQMSQAASHGLDLSSNNAGVDLKIVQPPTVSLEGTVDLNLTIGVGVNGSQSTFFIEPTPTQGTAPASITEELSGSTPTFSSAATIGVANAQITNGTASLDETASVFFNASYVTSSTSQTPFAPASPLTQLVQTTATGTASVVLPITSTDALVAGGSQTLSLSWSGAPSSGGTSNIASLSSGAWAALNTTTIAQIQSAASAAPVLLSDASGAAGLGANLPLMGSALGSAFDFTSVFDAAASSLAGVTNLDDAAAALSNALGTPVTFSLNAANQDIEFDLKVSQAFSLDVPTSVQASIDGTSLALSGTSHLSGVASASIRFGVAFDSTLADDARVYAIPGSDSFLSASFQLATAAPLVATAALGLMRLEATGVTFRVGAKNGDGVDPSLPANVTVAFKDPASNGRITLAEIGANDNALVAGAVFTGESEAAFTLTSGDGLTSVPAAIRQNLSTLSGAPEIVNASQIASLDTDVASLLSPTTLASADAAQITTGLNAIIGELGASIGSNPLFSQALPLVSDTLSGLTDTSAFIAAIQQALGTTLVQLTQSGVSTQAFASAFEAALTAALAPPNGTAPTYSFSFDASRMFAGQADAPTAGALGLPSDDPQLVFNIG